jgi:hypothetical protein
VAVRFVVLWLVPIAVASFLVRWLLQATVGRRAPRLAAAADAWLPWAPVLAVVVALTIFHPLVGLAAAVVAYLFLTSSLAVGSPLKPRR